MKETKRTYHRWTHREDNKVAILLDDGKTVKDIAKIIGIDEQGIYNRLHLLRKYRGTTSKREYRYISDKENAQIVEMAMRGYSLAYISKETGRHPNVIMHILHRNGIRRYDR